MKNLRFFMLSVAVFLGFGVAYAQSQITVKGTVTDSSYGETLPAVSVLLKGTNRGVITDMSGNYTISVPKDGVLVFSSIGFKTALIPQKAKFFCLMSPDGGR